MLGVRILWSLLLLLFTVHSIDAQMIPGDRAQEQMVMTNLSSMSLAFTENRGQWDERVLFRAEVGGATFYLCRNVVAYLFVRDSDELVGDDLFPRQVFPGMDDPLGRPKYKKEALLIKAQFIGANPDPEITAENRLPHNCNYFYGNEPSRWRADVPNYSAVIYRDVWPGIDLKYHGNGRGMKYDFIVNPGADISRIKIRCDGVDNLAITDNGDMQADTRFGLIHENIHSIYQEIAGSKSEIMGRYCILEPGVFGFEVDAYEPSLPLVIDPELIYSTYLGGSGDDQGWGIAVDASGSAYVTGFTSSSNFPTENPYDADYSGGGDVFVTKLSSSGNSLIYSTYLGGTGYDYGFGIAADGSGNAYVSGYTSSSDFPTADPYDDTMDGEHDAFVLKLSSLGNSLIYSTYLGGSDWEDGHGIAVDNTGSIYVTGMGASSDFPTENPYDADYNGGVDVFVTKLSSTGNSLIYSTYLGGTGYDEPVGISVDGSGSAYVTGGTNSLDFPTENAYDASFNGGDYDVFLSKLSAAGNSLIFSTYLGGENGDVGYGIPVDTSGSAYVAGWTFSSDFPTENPYDGNLDGTSDVFVSKFSSAGNSLIYSTYLGGNDDDRGNGIAIDGTRCAYVTGWTLSSDFPTHNPYDETYNGSYDVFISKLSASGISLVYSTYLGGSSIDAGFSIAVDDSGSAFVRGQAGPVPRSGYLPGLNSIGTCISRRNSQRSFFDGQIRD